jgi:hypothetical protein
MISAAAFLIVRQALLSPAPDNDGNDQTDDSANKDANAKD